MSEPTPKLKRLTPQAIRDLTEAHQRLIALSSKAIVEKNDDKEVAGLANYIGNTMLEHAPEFIGAWQVAQGEYQPLVLAVGKLLMRASAVMAPPSPPPVEGKEVVS
jgi:hypothetical protein